MEPVKYLMVSKYESTFPEFHYDAWQIPNNLIRS